MEAVRSEYTYSYYGSWIKKEKKPSIGVHYFMLDEHIKRTIEKEKTLFLKEAKGLINDYNVTVTNHIEKFNNRIKAINLELSHMRNFINSVAELNQLHVPQMDIENTFKKRTRTKKVDIKKEECDVENDDDLGYL